MPSLSWGSLQGSSLATLTPSNFSLSPGKQGAICTPAVGPSVTGSLSQMAHSRRQQNVALASVLSGHPLGAVSLTSFTLARFMRNFMVVPVSSQAALEPETTDSQNPPLL